MGRSGGGGGGHSSSGHGSSSHHGSSHHGSGGSSSFRSGGASFHSGPSRSGGGGFGGPSRSGGPGFGGPGGGPGFGGPGGGPGFGGPRRPTPPPPPPRHYGAPPPPPRRRGSGNGCATIVLVAIILIIYAFMALVRGANSTNISDDNISEYAEDQYVSIFDGREDGLLIVLDENDDGQIKYGAKANAIMDAYVEDMWNSYDANYNDDLGIQLGNMFTDTANAILADDSVSAINSDKGFDNHCYRDELNWVDTKSNLQNGAEYFYEATGIQPYVLLVKAKTISKATNKSAGVLKVLIIVCGAVIIVCIGFNWWKKKIAQKNKEQEDLERTLKTPLETFGTTGTVDDLAKKYDTNDTTTTDTNNTSQ